MIEFLIEVSQYLRDIKEDVVLIKANKNQSIALSQLGFVQGKSGMIITKALAPAALQRVSVILDELRRSAKKELETNALDDDTAKASIKDKRLEMNVLDDGTATLSSDEVAQVEQLQKDVIALEQGKVDLEAKLSEANAKLEELAPKDEPDIPESVRVRLEELEEANRQLVQLSAKERAEAILAKGSQKGLSKPILDLIGQVVQLEGFQVGEETIKLENKPGSIRSYMTALASKLVEVLPGTVPLTPKSEGILDTYKLESAGEYHYTDEEFEKALENVWN